MNEQNENSVKARFLHRMRKGGWLADAIGLIADLLDIALDP